MFFKSKDNKTQNKDVVKIAALLIHAAKIDENFSKHEEEIIRKTLSKISEDNQNIDNIINEAKIIEENTNQILDFTREVKNISEDEKKVIIEALWKIIYSDENADMYETNLMRRLSGLLYLDIKVVGDLKDKVKKNLL